MNMSELVAAEQDLPSEQRPQQRQRRERCRPARDEARGQRGSQERRLRRHGASSREVRRKGTAAPSSVMVSMTREAMASAAAGRARACPAASG